MTLAAESRPPVGWAAVDSLAIAWRNLIVLRRVPLLLVAATTQPIIFLLIFRYGLGGAVQVPGFDYVDYLLPGVFVQAIGAGAMTTSIAVAEDLSAGLIERFRALPMARSAVLIGRAVADMARNLFVVLLLFAVGYAVGFRVETGVGEVAAAIGGLLAFGFAFSWAFALLGLLTRNAETAQALGFALFIPLLFASSAFVPPSSMPGALEAFAANRPITAAVDAVRALLLGGATTEPLLEALAWTAGLLLVLIPLTARRYRRVA